MKILALDSSGLVASVAVAEDDVLTAEYTVNYKKTHSQTLLPMLRELKERGIDVVVCGVPSATMTMLRRAGIVELLGEQSFYWSVERALLDHRPHPLAAFDSAEA